eukprot:g12112.t1
MSDFKDQMAKKLQAAARGYIARKTGFGAKKKAAKKQKVGHGGKPAKKKNKDEDMQAKIIQAAYRKYKEYSKKH